MTRKQKNEQNPRFSINIIARKSPKMNKTPGKIFSDNVAYVNVPNDLSKVKTKMAFNLTKRQLPC